MVACVACVVCLAIAVQPPQDDTTTKHTRKHCSVRIVSKTLFCQLIAVVHMQRRVLTGCARSACRRPTGPLLARSTQRLTTAFRQSYCLMITRHAGRRRQEQASLQEKHVCAYPLVFCKLV